MTRTPGFREFVALMALCMSLVALAIDAMLPALAEIAADLDVTDANDRQHVLSVLFVGLAIGQFFYGPISDSFGRRGPIFVGFALFLIGSLLSLLATSYTMMLAGRFLQGLGAAGPRIITVAIIRDGSAGREMARVMSLVMMVFILVPAIAPALGQGILLLASWREIFLSLIVLAIIAVSWFYFRQPESLPVENRRRFNISEIVDGVIEICNDRAAIAYTIDGGLVFGAFVGFLKYLL